VVEHSIFKYGVKERGVTRTLKIEKSVELQVRNPKESEMPETKTVRESPWRRRGSLPGLYESPNDCEAWTPIVALRLLRVKGMNCCDGDDDVSLSHETW
jgi:hypothetical protein